MNRQIICNNKKINGCENIVMERGSIYCEKCNEERKNFNKQKKDIGLEELLHKNYFLEKELEKLKNKVQNPEIIIEYERMVKEKQLEIDNQKKEYERMVKEKQLEIDNQKKILNEFDIKYESLIKELDKYDMQCLSCIQLEKENNKLNDIMTKLRNENKIIISEKEKYHINYSQLKIDNTKLQIEIKRLEDENNHLHDQNELLLHENKN